jgi:hypothetical protein
VAILAVVAAFFYFGRKPGTLDRALSDFAVEDTAAVDRIFLADKMGHRVTLTKEKPGRWIVNGKARARNDMVNTLLETIRRVDVRSPVAKAAFNNVMKKMAATSVKVEIYAGGRPVKTYYVGHETQDQLGTFMYLEHSSVPFVMHIPGFEGYLTTRYAAAEEDWIPRTVFDFEMAEIEELVNEDYETPGASFAIRRDPAGGFALFAPPGGARVQGAVPDRILQYLEQFSALYYEFTAKNFPQESLDSIRAAGPFREIRVRGAGRSRRATLYRMPQRRSLEELLDMGIVSDKPYDTDRFYVVLDGGEAMHAAQYYGFGKLFVGPRAFLPPGADL